MYPVSGSSPLSGSPDLCATKAPDDYNEEMDDLGQVRKDDEGDIEEASIGQTTARDEFRYKLKGMKTR